MARVAVITGASAGIGRATALAFAKDGADVALISRNEERLRRLQAEIQALGRKAMVLAQDVADAAATEDAARRVEETLGPIDVWVSNAMASVFSPVVEMTTDEFRRVTEVTYLGAVYGVLAALRRMKARDHGSIVIVGSALAYRGIPLQSAYCAAKAALRGFNDSLQSELLHDRSRVRVTMVQLSAHNTPQFDWARSRMPRKAQPVPPIYQPERAARAILRAAEHGGRELTVGYPAWRAIWAAKLFPRLVDWYLAKFGYEAQMADEPKDPAAPDNLWQSVPGPYGAHGRFDRIARE